MFNKKILILTIFFVSLLAVSAVSAADNATDDIVSAEKNTDEFSVEFDSVTNDVIGTTEENKLSESIGNYTELNDEITSKNDGETLILTKNYQYNLINDKNDLKISKSITIDGNGSYIDGNNAANFFVVSGSNITLKNIIFKNAKSNQNSISWNGVNGTIINCTFENNCIGSSSYSVISWGNNANNGVIKSSKFFNGWNNNGFIYFAGACGEISDCHFENCNKTAIRITGDIFTVTNCSFENISATYLYTSGNNGTINNLNLTNFINNALMIYGNNIQINNCIFMNNTIGDGININAKKLTFNNSLFKNNKKSFIHFSDFTTFIDCVFENNTGVSVLSTFATDTRLINNTFKNNKVIFLVSIGKNAFLENNRFICNNVSNTGLVNIGGNNAKILDCLFLNNSVTDSAGGIYLYGDNCSIEKCDFINCYADNNGGALYIKGNNISVSDCHFENCSAKRDGGTIMMINLNNASISDCTFISNSNAIYSQAINDTVVLGNNIYVTGGSQSNGIRIESGNATIINNYITSSGNYAIYAVYSNLIVKNNGLTANGKYGDDAITRIGGGTIHTEGNTKVYLNPNIQAIADSRFNETTLEMVVTINVSINETATENVTVTLYDSKGNIKCRENVTIIGGKANFIKSGLDDDEYNYTIDYLGDDNFKPASIIGTVTVKDPRSVAPLDVVATAKFDTTELVMFVTINTTSTASGNVTVTFYAPDGSIMCSEDVDFVNGEAIFTEPYLADGVYNYTVEYKANGEWKGNFVSGNVTVKAPRSVAPLDVVATAKFDTTELVMFVTINTTSVASGNVTVTFYAPDGSIMCSEDVDFVNGEAIFTEPYLADGVYNYTVEYRANAEWKANSVRGNVTVNDTRTIPNVDNIVLSLDGDSGIIKLPNDAKGKVILTIAGKIYETEVINGVANVKLPNLVNGQYEYAIAYSGDEKYSSFNKTGKLIVNKAAPKSATKITLTLKKVKVKKSAKKLVLKATLKINGKTKKGLKVKFKFNKKTYTAKTNKKGIAKVTIKKKVLKKLKVGKKVKYQVSYGKKTVKRTAKVKK